MLALSHTHSSHLGGFMSLQKVSAAASPEKLKALDLALSAIEKQFGKGAIMKLDNKSAVEKLAVIPANLIIQTVDYSPIMILLNLNFNY